MPGSGRYGYESYMIMNCSLIQNLQWIKKLRLEYGDSVMTHAMLLNSSRYRKNDKSLPNGGVENSWGEKSEE